VSIDTSGRVLRRSVIDLGRRRPTQAPHRPPRDPPQGNK
jgi:hypothetical protein